MPVRDEHGLTEEEFLKEYAKKNYPKPSLTADIIILSRDSESPASGSTEVLLVRRRNHPCLGLWALPGGFANPGECIEETAARELCEETGLRGIPLRLTGVYSKPGRDPRGWVVTAAFCAVVEASAMHVQAGDDAADADWFRISLQDGVLRLTPTGSHGETLSRLAFDHEEILRDAVVASHIASL